MIALVLLGLLVVFFLPRWQARHHQKLIREDGSRDSLKKFFHHKWTSIRAFILVGTAFIIHLPVAGDHILYLVQVALFSLFGFAYFGLVFTPRLNEARDKERWYVSRDPRAAWTDRFLVWLSDEPEALAKTLFLFGTIILFVLYLISYSVYCQ